MSWTLRHGDRGGTRWLQIAPKLLCQFVDMVVYDDRKSGDSGAQPGGECALTAFAVRESFTASSSSPMVRRQHRASLPPPALPPRPRSHPFRDRTGPDRVRAACDVQDRSMTFEHLDNEELLRLSLSAIDADRDADAMSMLKEILARRPDHVQAIYLLAAQHAQIGLLDRAEAGFRETLALAPDLAPARFQLGQLLALSGRADESRVVLAPLADDGDVALAAYARAVIALASDDVDAGLVAIEEGLAAPQRIPALAADMRRLAQTLRSAEVERAPAAPAFLAGYGYGRAGSVE